MAEEGAESKTVYVGSLSWNTTEDSLKEAFSKFGNVTSTRIPMNESNKSRGFGFVEFEKADDAKKAVDEMNEKELDGRNIRVNISKPRSERPQGGDRRGGDRRGGDRYERRGDRRDRD